MKYYENAYAKINLFLDVTGKMENGFHSICSIMHTVSLSDSISVELAESGKKLISIYVKGKYYLNCGDKNLAYRAAEAFMDAYGEKFYVHIGINKRIPVAAGLAGGSSDAAAVLRALNRAKGDPFSYEQLCKIGEAIGSDVPFCIMGKTYLCEGRGEVLTPIQNKNVYNFVIATANERVSTPAAYGKLDSIYHDFENIEKTSDISVRDVIRPLCNFDKKTLCRSLYNVFECAVLSECPGAEELKRKMLSLGALGTMMSGSGPSVFGIFADRESAQKAANEIGADAYAVQSVI
jgi:4-diphosphocytidyl-2-C-methyl-D-erythritol kinase